MNRLVTLARLRVTASPRTHWEGCERDHYECLIQRLADEVERLDSRLHEAQEVYAGFEGFIPQTAPEDYCMRIIREMAHALMGVSQPQPQTPGQTHEPSQPASDDRQADQEKKP